MPSGTLGFELSWLSGLQQIHWTKLEVLVYLFILIKYLKYLRPITSGWSLHVLPLFSRYSIFIPQFKYMHAGSLDTKLSPRCECLCEWYVCPMMDWQPEKGVFQPLT